MRIVAKTDVGVIRDNNQDCYTTGELEGGACFGIVCDGMGGAAEGAFASNEAVRLIRERIISGYFDGMSDISLKSLLFSAIEYANRQIHNLSLSEKKYEGMGTTVVAAIVNDRFLYVANAGDSRAYQMNTEQNAIVQLTKDHSVVQKMIDDGEITPDEAVNHPKKNLITRAVGAEPDIRLDFCQEEYDHGDILLLCTDGLTNYIKKEEILQAAQSHPFYDFMGTLVDKAKNNGGGDNITIVAISM